MDAYENNYLSRAVFLRLVLVSWKGILVIARSGGKADAADGMENRKALGISAVNSMVVFAGGVGVPVLSWDGMEVLPTDELYVLIRGFHNEAKGASYDGWNGIRSIDDDSADRICGILAPLENGECPGLSWEEMTGEDGRVYVKAI